MNTPGAQKHIYIVDDDSFLTSLYEAKAKDMPIELGIGKNAAHALEEFRRGVHPDVIALDVTMLGMSGVELLKAIRSEKLVPDAKIVILSNTTDDDVIAEAEKLGVTKFIVKASLLPPEVLEELFKIAEGKPMTGKKIEVEEEN